MNVPKFSVMVNMEAPGVSAASLAQVYYQWEVELGLQRRERDYLLREKRKIQKIIRTVKTALNGPYGHKFFPHYLDELLHELFLVKRELESLCD